MHGQHRQRQRGERDPSARRRDDAQRVITPGEPAELLVARDQRVLALRLVVPADAGLGAPVQLVADAKPGKAAQALREAWLTR